VGSVIVSADTLKLNQAEVGQLTGTVLDNQGRPQTTWRVAWTSSDLSVASVDSSGAVLAVGTGTAVVTAAAGTALGTAVVTVRAPLTLLSPAEGAYVYQYSLAPFCNSTYGFQIQFDWTDYVGAVAYELWVKHAGATYPLDSLTVAQSSYTDTRCVSYVITDNATDWQWHVTAILGDGRRVTSATGTFNFTDPFQP
jgi:hypothetical protein